MTETAIVLGLALFIALLFLWVYERGYHMGRHSAWQAVTKSAPTTDPPAALDPNMRYKTELKPVNRPVTRATPNPGGGIFEPLPTPFAEPDLGPTPSASEEDLIPPLE